MKFPAMIFWQRLTWWGERPREPSLVMPLVVRGSRGRSPHRQFALHVGIIFLFVTGVNALAADIATNLPPPVDVKIVFDRDIRPILETSCLRCHGAQKPKSHFRLDFRAGALAGGDENTNDIVPGDSAKSWLIHYVARQVPDMEMPPDDRGDPLTPQQIGLLRAWIDQGADWSTTNQPPALEMTFAPTLRWFDVSGNQGKFRELEGAKAGFSEGVENFSVTEQLSPDEKVSLEGYAIIPEQNFNFKIALDKADRGFIHAGFDQWRKYYSDTGGFDPAVTPAEFNLDHDLYVDNGRAWIDFGLDLPRWPLIVLGYEYQYRKGNESTLDWGTANGKNIYPATQTVNEQTHTLKLEATKTFDGWRLENAARVDFYTEKNAGAESSILFGGTTPDEFVNTRDDYRQVRGMDTLVLEKQIRDWWFLNGGFYYSHLSGSDFFNQTTAIPAFDFNSALSSQRITLSRESEIFSVASLFTPLAYLNFSLGMQNEWTRESGFSEGIPDLDFGGTVPADSSLDEFKASQTANFRFTRIPFSVVFGDAQFSENNYSVDQAENPDDFQRHTVANNFRYDLKTGFSASPWRWLELSAQYADQDSDTDYSQLADVFNGVSGPTNGYPGFILGRDIHSDQFETKLALRPANWLKTTLTYQLTATDYSSKTGPAFDPNLGEPVSPGGPVVDGHYNLQTYGINAVITPFRRLYFSGGFTYSHSRADTADNGDPSVVPYQGNIYTVNAAANYALNPKTSLQGGYNFSYADYAENNGVAGVPLGLNYTRHDVIVGITRQLTKNLSGALHYEFSQYAEPSGGNANNFTAHGVFATIAYQWP
jgi:hypothetical protein